MGALASRAYSCDRCGALTQICSDCDRGNRYCTLECQRVSRIETCRRANGRYQRSAKGRRNHRRRQKSYRARQATRAAAAAETKSSTSSPATHPPITVTIATGPPLHGKPPATVTHHGSSLSGHRVLLAAGRPDVLPGQDLPPMGPISTPAGLGSLVCCMCGRSVSDHLRFTFLSGEDPG
jgi:hypothetical protein